MSTALARRLLARLTKRAPWLATAAPPRPPPPPPPRAALPPPGAPRGPPPPRPRPPPGRGAAAEQLADGGQQALRPRRHLALEVADQAEERLPLGAVDVARAQHHDRRRPRPLVRAQPVGDLESAHAGHHQVEDDQRRPLGDRQGDAARTVERRQEAVAAALEVGGEDVVHRRVVVDHQDPRPARRPRRDQLADAGDQGVALDRLDEEVVGAEGEAELAVSTHADDDHRRRLGRRVVLEPGQHLPAVAAGHHQVEGDHRRVLAARPRQSLVAAGGVDHAVAGAAQGVGEEAGGVGVVLDHQHGRRVEGGRLGGGHQDRTDHLGRSGADERQESRERAADPELGGDADRPTLDLEIALGQGETETGAARRFQAVGLDLAKLLEDQGAVLRGDAGAVVDDVDAHAGGVQRPLVSGERGGTDHYLAAARRVLDGVRQQVDEDLLQLVGVGDHLRQPARRLDHDHHPVLLGHAAHQVDGLGHDLGRADRLEVELHVAGLDLGDVEQGVDQRQEVLAAGADVAQEAGLARVDLVGELAFENLGEADDRVERRPQLVAHVGQEATLQAVGLLDLEVLLGQLGAAPVELDREPRQLGQLALVLGAQAADLEAPLAQVGDALDWVERAAVEDGETAEGPPQLLVEAADRPLPHQQAEVGRTVGDRCHQRGAGAGDEGRGGGVGQVEEEPQRAGAAVDVDQQGDEGGVAQGRHPGQVDPEAAVEAADDEPHEGQRAQTGDRPQDDPRQQVDAVEPGRPEDDHQRQGDRVDGDAAALPGEVELDRPRLGHAAVAARRLQRVVARGHGSHCTRLERQAARRAAWRTLEQRGAGRDGPAGEHP